MKQYLLYLIFEEWDSGDRPRKSSTSAEHNPMSCFHCTKLWLCPCSKTPLLHQICTSSSPNLTDNRRHHQLTGAHSFSSFIAPNIGCASSPTQTRRQDTCSTPTPLCTILIIVYQIYNTSQNFPYTSRSMCPKKKKKKSRPM